MNQLEAVRIAMETLSNEALRLAALANAFAASNDNGMARVISRRAEELRNARTVVSEIVIAPAPEQTKQEMVMRNTNVLP